MSMFSSFVETEPGAAIRPRPDTWAASPIDPFATEEIRASQYKVCNALEQRARKSAKKLGLPADLQEYLAIDTLQRFHYESSLNQQSFNARLVESLEDFPLELLSAFDHSFKADALPGEIIDVAEELGMPSFEAGKLSHIGGEEIEQLEVMRTAISNEIVRRGGVLFDDDHNHLSLVNGDVFMMRSQSSNYLSMVRSRHIGGLPSGALIREKSQFILRIDRDSDFDRDIANQIRGDIQVSVRKKDEDMDGAQHYTEWLDKKIRHIPGFLDAVNEALESNRFDIAIPLSTTIYGYNPEIKQQSDYLVAERKKQRDLNSTNMNRHMGRVASGGIKFIRDVE